MKDGNGINTNELKNEELTQVSGGNDGISHRRRPIDIPPCYSDPHQWQVLDCQNCRFYARCTNPNKKFN